MYFISKRGVVVKLFFILSFSGLFMYTILAFYTIHTAFNSDFKLITIPKIVKHINRDYSFKKDAETKYILLWNLNNSHINPFGEGGEPFYKAGCFNKNCYITTNKELLDGDYTRFHVIIYNNSISRIMSTFKNAKRSPFQKYVFYSMQPSGRNPVCSLRVENFFNWTWSYKLNSDIFTPFIYVKDMRGNVVAPKSHVLWDSKVTMHKKVDVTLSKSKSKSVSWVIDNCNEVPEGIFTFAKHLKAALKLNDLSFDIYGCGFKECPKEGCLKAIDKYYFYLAYEKSLSDDYVSKEVLKAYHHNAVPIVMGGANYRKFLPDSSYLNARNMTVEVLASIIDYAIINPDVYNNYFGWKKHYTVEEFNINRGLCKLCSNINDKNKFNTYSSYKNFRKWWYQGLLRDQCVPKGAETFAEILSYINSSSIIKKAKAI